MSKVYFLSDLEPTWFPDPKLTNKDGLVAVTETLGTDRLLLAYKMVYFHGLKQVNTHSGTGSLLTHALFYILKTSEFLEVFKKSIIKKYF